MEVSHEIESLVSKEDYNLERMRKHPLYKEAVSFWKSEAGKKALRKQRHNG